jgi:beta-galactosidase
VEYFVQLDFYLKQDTGLLRAGHKMAWDQFELPDAAPATVLDSRNFPPLKWNVNANAVQVTGKNFEITIDGTNGLTSWRSHGTELIRSPLIPSFWRALTDNDRGRQAGQKQGYWEHANAGLVPQQFAAAKQEDHLEVSVKWVLPKADNAAWTTTYKIYGNGEVFVAADFQPVKTDRPPMPRMGMQLSLPAGFDRVTWLGPGPEETYCDRMDAPVGLYSGTVDDQFYAGYVKPGETGNKVDTRWIALTNKKGAGLLAIGEPQLSVNALHYGTEDLNAGLHPFQLPHRDYTVLNLDWKQQGVGGDNSWGAWPHKEYLIPSQSYRYQFRLRPIAAGENPEKLARE